MSFGPIPRVRVCAYAPSFERTGRIALQSGDPDLPSSGAAIGIGTIPSHMSNPNTLVASADPARIRLSFHNMTIPSSRNPRASRSAALRETTEGFAAMRAHTRRCCDSHANTKSECEISERSEVSTATTPNTRSQTRGETDLREATGRSYGLRNQMSEFRQDGERPDSFRQGLS
jgi:hypothetical protein